MAEVLNVQRRDDVGKRHTKRLRNSGAVPAILYGHKEENVSLAIPADELQAAVRHGSRLVELKGAVNESALIRDLQWDIYGTAVQHVDLARVSKDERIKVSVALELRGEAPGVREGGVIEQLVHEALIECLATAIPDKLQVKINQLALNGEITFAQVPLPEGVTLLSDPEVIVVHCVEPAEEVEELPTGEGAEPEVIGRKPDEEAEEG